ncbi:putative calcium-binding protein cml27 [Quercus suber]|uniref:Calcium-binding protein cml27 n=1 Tax=Quercus suber TaxID=58331 RepID=A0AAW0JPP2_QUESU
MKCSVEDCDRMIRSIDSDGDENVNFEEFQKMMTTAALESPSRFISDEVARGLIELKCLSSIPIAANDVDLVTSTLGGV